MLKQAHNIKKRYPEAYLVGLLKAYKTHLFIVKLEFRQPKSNAQLHKNKGLDQMLLLHFVRPRHP